LKTRFKAQISWQSRGVLPERYNFRQNPIRFPSRKTLAKARIYLRFAFQIKPTARMQWDQDPSKR